VLTNNARYCALGIVGCSSWACSHLCVWPRTPSRFSTTLPTESPYAGLFPRHATGNRWDEL